MAKITYTFVLDGSVGKSRKVTGQSMLNDIARRSALGPSTGWSYTVRGTQAELEALGAYKNHYGQWVYASPDKYFIDCFVWLATTGGVMDKYTMDTECAIISDARRKIEDLRERLTLAELELKILLLDRDYPPGNQSVSYDVYLDDECDDDSDEGELLDAQDDFAEYLDTL